MGPFYVYLLVDPRPGQGEPFYVGKGTGDRLLSHGLDADRLAERGQGPKSERIREIRAMGYEPGIEVVRHGLIEREAFQIEAALIDCLPGLTNKIRGQDVERGRQPLFELVRRYGAPLLTIDDPLLLIRLGPWIDLADPITGRKGHGYRPGMSRRDLYESTRVWWVLSPSEIKRRKIEHAVAVFQGVTRAIYSITTWQSHKAENRHGFSGLEITDGPLFTKVVGELGHRVPFARHSQNPISYWPPRLASG